MHAYAVALPHETFSAIFHRYPSAWEKCIMPGAAHLKRFWHTARVLPQWEDHDLASRGSLSHMIPVVVHADETLITGRGKIWSSSAIIFSFASMLCHIWQLGTKKVQNYIWACWNKSFSDQTNEDFMRVLTSTFEALYRGVWPSADWRGVQFPPDSPDGRRAGTPLANGLKGVVVSISGDMDFYAQYLGLPRWNSANPCSMCQSRRGPATWHGFAPDSPWRTTLWRPGPWRAWLLRSRNCLFDSHLFSVLHSHYDLMHCKYLGFCQQLFGSVLSILTGACAQPSDGLAVSQAIPKRPPCLDSLWATAHKDDDDRQGRTAAKDAWKSFRDERSLRGNVESLAFFCASEPGAQEDRNLVAPHLPQAQQPASCVACLVFGSESQQ